MPETSEGQGTGQDPSFRNGEIDTQEVDELLRESYNAYEMTGMLMGLPDNTISSNSGESYSREDLIDRIALAGTADGNPHSLTSKFGIRSGFFLDDGRRRSLIPRMKELPEVKRYASGDKKGEIERIDLKDSMQLLGYLKAKELSGLNAADVAESIDEVERAYRLGEIDSGILDKLLKIGGIPGEIRNSTIEIIKENSKLEKEPLGFQRVFEKSTQEDPDESELITEIPGIPHKSYGRSDELYSGNVVPHITGRKRVPVENPGASAIAAANFRLPEGYELGIDEDGKFEPVRIDRHEE